MESRVKLQTILEEILGSRNVYFQPPPNVQMNYPCIVYKREGEDRKHANDLPYLRKKRYNVTVIDRNPDSDIPDRVGALPLCSFSTHFTKDHLNHDIFSIYF